jgi:hypothetical protein
VNVRQVFGLIGVVARLIPYLKFPRLQELQFPVVFKVPPTNVKVPVLFVLKQNSIILLPLVLVLQTWINAVLPLNITWTDPVDPSFMGNAH